MVFRDVPGWLKRWVRVSFERPAVAVGGTRLDLRYRGITPFWRGWWLVELVLDKVPESGYVELEVSGAPRKRQSCLVRVPIASARLSKRLFHVSWRVRQVVVKPPRDGVLVQVGRISIAPALHSFAVRHVRAMLASGSRDLSGRPTQDIDKVLPLSQEVSVREADRQLALFLDEAAADLVEGEASLYRRWMRFREPGLFVPDGGDLGDGPRISVVMPVHEPLEAHLSLAIDSVCRQVYPNWELCIADDASDAPHVREVIESFRARDQRIKVEFLDVHGHISISSNRALKLATGEFVVFLDHDDELSPYALQELARALKDNPQLDILYSDEDLLDPSGARCSPHFKSDWNPYLLYSHNYVTHLCAYRRSLVERVGGLRTGVEGAQDYDLLLRCSCLTDRSRIHHIPKVLYHWRMSATSTSAGSERKRYTHEAGRKALKEHFAARGIPATIADAGSDNFYRVLFEHNRPSPAVTLVVPTKNHVVLLKQCVDGLLHRTRYRNVQLLIVDNASDDEETLVYLNKISESPSVDVLKFDEPFNFARICNFAARHATGEILGFLNNDIDVIHGDWLDEMAMLVRRSEVGCVGAKLLYEDGTVQHAGVILGLGGYAAHAHRCFPREHGGYFGRLKVRQNVSAVTGACMLVRKSVYEEVGGMDEQFEVAYNDVDFCLKVREAGYLNVFTPFACLYHFESKTRGYEDTPEKQARFQREKDRLAAKWGDRIRRDPYYNPNLTHAREDFSIGL